MPRHSGAARPHDPKAGASSRRLFVYNAGFLRQARLRAILQAAGYRLRLGLPHPEDAVAVWGRSPTAWRGEAIAQRQGAPLIRVEDAFLRSIHPGRLGSAPLGLLIDPVGVHFDAAQPSMPERILARDGLDDNAILQRARDGMARLQALELSKYNNFDETLSPPAPGYVLVIDQTAGDAAIRHGNASAATFREMLAHARIDHPGARIVITTHPETRAGLRAGHFNAADCDARTTLLTAPVSPWKLLEGAIAVYTVSSQLGMEAVFAGHRPRVFGQPFYAGWGLTQDETPVARRQRRLTRAQLFAAAYILAPTWFDPCRNRICSFEDAVDQLEADVRAWRTDRSGYVAGGMRRWKRPTIQRFFGAHGTVSFADDAAAVPRAQKHGQPLLWWASRITPGVEQAAAARNLPLMRVEDGFLRSRGLGADLVPPLSLVVDRQGPHYDPNRPSDLEVLIAQAPPPGGQARAEKLLARIRTAGLSKYNLGGALPDLPAGHRILVPGQVEDDASVRLGAGKICTNLALLTAVRAENPDAIVLFKPHPDVEAGLRRGAVATGCALRFADRIVTGADPIALIEACDEVWTMTSLLGFEALLRSKRVTCTGVPFYAGWGLTRDLGQVPARRQARPDLLQLVHAALIAYPRYIDPISRKACPPEVVVDRLFKGELPARSATNRIIAKLQGFFAGQAWLWR